MFSFNTWIFINLAHTQLLLALAHKAYSYDNVWYSFFTFALLGEANSAAVAREFCG